MALKDDKDGGESPWESTLPPMNQQPIVDEVMSDAMEEHSQQTESEQPKVPPHSVARHTLGAFFTCKLPWESTLPAMSPQPIVGEVMGDAMEAHSRQID